MPHQRKQVSRDSLQPSSRQWFPAGGCAQHSAAAAEPRLSRAATLHAWKMSGRVQPQLAVLDWVGLRLDTRCSAGWWCWWGSRRSYPLGPTRCSRPTGPSVGATCLAQAAPPPTPAWWLHPRGLCSSGGWTTSQTQVKHRGAPGEPQFARACMGALERLLLTSLACDRHAGSLHGCSDAGASSCDPCLHTSRVSAEMVLHMELMDD